MIYSNSTKSFREIHSGPDLRNRNKFSGMFQKVFLIGLTIDTIKTERNSEDKHEDILFLKNQLEQVRK